MRAGFLLLLLAGCHAAAGPADLAAPTDDMHVADLAVEDLAHPQTPDDMAYDFCADVMAALAGATPSSCASEYMRDFVRCVAPAVSCHAASSDVHPRYCFDDGTVVVYQEELGNYSVRAAAPGGTVCSYGGPEFLEVGGSFCIRSDTQACGPGADGFTQIPGATIDLSDTTFTCASGATVVIGPLSQTCRATLRKLIDPAVTCDGKGSITSCSSPP